MWSRWMHDKGLWDWDGQMNVSVLGREKGWRNGWWEQREGWAEDRRALLVPEPHTLPWEPCSVYVNPRGCARVGPGMQRGMRGLGLRLGPPERATHALFIYCLKCQYRWSSVKDGGAAGLWLGLRPKIWKNVQQYHHLDKPNRAMPQHKWTHWGRSKIKCSHIKFEPFELPSGTIRM